ncbi:MAG: hypothetical protein WBV22_08005 [Anaerolineaceae bacterium]
MSEKMPLLNKKHILVIALMTLVSGIISMSPSLLGYIHSDTGLMTPTPIESISNTRETSNATQQSISPVIVTQTTYTYILPFIFNGYGISVQPGSPVYIANFAHPEAGCNWAGIAGQIFGKDGNPILGYTVIVSGTISEQTVALSGVASNAQTYGIGGYEIKLADAPFTSSGALVLSIYDSNNIMLFKPIPIVTYQDCQKNVVIINFVIDN